MKEQSPCQQESLGATKQRLEAVLAEALRRKDFQTIVKSIITDAESVLDIGCGIGDYLKYTHPRQRVVGVEPHAPYIEKAREVAPWAEFVNTDALQFLARNEEQFDCVLLIDVIEHLTEEDAVRMVHLAQRLARRMLFAQIPIGFHPQERDVWNLGGDYWQTHRSTWDEGNIGRLGFTNVIFWRDWYDWEEEAKSRDMALAFYSRHPQISVVVPTYNQAEWLPKTLDSIIAQTYPFWEAVVVNDGSTDNTAAVLEKYSRLDSRIRVFHKPNGGISSALNTGIQNATGQYFCWLSSDDLFYPDKLQLQVDCYSQLDARYALVFGAFDLIDPEDRVKELPLEKPFIDGYEFPRFLKYDYIDGCTVMIPLPLLKELGGFNLQFKHAQDTELWFRLASLGYRFHFIPAKLTLRRVHPQQGFSDFSIDCRYDGYAMIHFYLKHYPFRRFFQNVDFNKKEQRWQFIRFFYDLLGNPDHLVNHPTLHSVFWPWFKSGLLTLPMPIRMEILNAGISAFEKAKTGGEWWRYVLRELRQSWLEVQSKPIRKTPQSAAAPQITACDRSQEREFWEQVYQWGKACEQKKDDHKAFYAYKYLADWENPFYLEGYNHFIATAYRLGYFDKFLRSFRRKADISTFPDNVKAFYLWCLLKGEYSRGEAERIADSIHEESLRKRARDWIVKCEPTLLTKEHIRFWNYAVDLKTQPAEGVANQPWETTVVSEGVINEVHVTCPQCGTLMEHSFYWPLTSVPNSKDFFCIHCFRDYRLSEEVFLDFFLSKVWEVAEPELKERTRPHVYFLLRYTKIVGGGVKRALELIDWLAQVGCRITIYSDDDPPTQRPLPGEFIKVKDHYEDEFVDPALVVVFSVYDVPKILAKVPINRIVHLCQGYEGYHIGRNFIDLRRDKYFYTALHSIPVQNILVSAHLMELFRSHFNRTGHYLPNGIDLGVFYPQPNTQKIDNSLLFIGNPLDRLKGFKFLLDALAYLQNSSQRLNPLHLIVVGGFQGQDLPQTLDSIPNLKIHWQRNLSSSQVADFIRRVRLVVVTSMYEGFSLPALEAMACGTPVITTNNMGAESFCQHEFNSLIVPFGDTTTLGRYIHEILTGARDVNQQQANGFRTALEYSQANSMRHFFKVFEKLLATSFPEENKNSLLAPFIESESRFEQMVRTAQQSSVQRQPLVSIIILTYNCLTYTQKCIESILQATDYPFELVLVDNGSTDGTIEYLHRLQAEQPNVQVIYNSSNRGFAAGNNQGAQVARGKYLLFLNNDVVVSSGWLGNLVTALERHPRIGAVGPMTNKISGRQAYSHIPYAEEDLNGFHTFARQVSQAANNKVTPRYRLAGFALLMPKALFTELGGFDESFGTGNFEDDDLCLRIRTKGYRLFVHEGVYIHHYGSQTFKGNGIDYVGSIRERQQLFLQKWPKVDYQRLMEIDKSLVAELDEYKQRANAAMRDGAWAQALELLNLVVDENPLDTESALLLAQCYYQTQKYPLALEQLKNLLRCQPPPPEALALAATIASEQNDLRTAEKLWSKAITLKPSDCELRLRLAETLLAQGKLEEAVRQYEILCDWQPQNGAYLIQLAELYTEQNQNEQAKRVLERIDRLGITSPRLADLQRRLMPATPPIDDDQHLLNNQGAEQLRRGDWESAQTTFQKVLALNPQSEDALLGMALYHLHHENFPAVIHFLDRLNEHYPQNPLGYHLRGVIAFREGALQTAQDCFRKALQIEPNLKESKQLYAECLYRTKRIKDSRIVYQQLLEQEPDNKEFLARIGSLAIEEGETQLARAMFVRLLQSDPQNAEYQRKVKQLEQGDG